MRTKRKTKRKYKRKTVNLRKKHIGGGILTRIKSIFYSNNVAKDATTNIGAPTFLEKAPLEETLEETNDLTSNSEEEVASGKIVLTQGSNRGKLVDIVGTRKAIAGLQRGEQHFNAAYNIVRDRYFVHPATGEVTEDSGCFTGKGLITMSDLTKKLVQDINIGDEILTCNSDKKTKIVGIIKESKNDKSRYLYKINNSTGEGLITHDHPILINGIWKLPSEVCDKIISSEVLYNFVTKDNLPFIIDNNIILSYGGYAYNIDNNPNNLYNPRSIIFRTRLNNIPFAFVYLKNYFNIEDNNNIIEKSREELDIAHNQACEYVKKTIIHKNENFNIINTLNQIEISV
jgi:hypothetical protein